MVELKQAKQADIRYTIYDNDLLPNGNKKESKKESAPDINCKQMISDDINCNQMLPRNEKRYTRIENR